MSRNSAYKYMYHESRKVCFRKKIQCYIFFRRQALFNVNFDPNTFYCWIPENEDAIRSLLSDLLVL